MELKAKDQYYIEPCGYLSPELMNSLVSLYQPLIGSHAAMLYLTLLSEGMKQKLWEDHGRLCDIMNISIMQMEKAFRKLEEFNLIRTYVKEEPRVRYLYLMNLPLSITTFKSNDLFCSMLYHNLGNKNAEMTLTKFNVKSLKCEDYMEITSRMDDDVLERYKAEHVQFSKVKEKETIDTNRYKNSFDYDSFFSKTSLLVFPSELRTDDNLELIGSVADLNGLSVDEIVILAGKNVIDEPLSFDKEHFIKDASRKNPVSVVNKNNPYDISPVVFLQNKQDGKPVSMADRHLIEKLAYVRGLNNEVINVLVEYVLEHYDHKLPASLVDKLACEWDRKKITTAKTAKASLNGNSYKEKKMPDYTDEKVEEDEAVRQKLIQQFKEANQ